MTTKPANPAQPESELELVLDLIIDAPREKVYEAWTTPELMKQWFTPRPWTTRRVEIDLRPGGSSLVVMADENGNEYPNPGVYLEVVPNEKLVFTDAFTAGWKPAGKPFMVAELTFADEGGKTRYTARARHWNVETREEHEKMGFHDGWKQVADQLEELVGNKS